MTVGKLHVFSLTYDSFTTIGSLVAYDPSCVTLLCIFETEWCIRTLTVPLRHCIAPQYLDLNDEYARTEFSVTAWH